MTMELKSIHDIEPSTYNPRTADPARLDLIRLSLSKLGFLLPIYSTPEGEILSGHQRHLVTSEMLEWEQMPVSTTKSMVLDKRKAVNVLFNRATNDFEISENGANGKLKIEEMGVYDMAAKLPDKVGEDRFPCMRPEQVPIGDLMAANSKRWGKHPYSIAKTMAQHGVIMPMVVRRSDLYVTNGVGRLQLHAERKAETVDVIFITDEEAEFAQAMLNYLSMDFDIGERYADILRHNSFRRSRLDPKDFSKPLSNSFVWDLIGIETDTHEFDHMKPENQQAWREFYGDPVLDFGAGRGKDTHKMLEMGMTVSSFDPYLMKDNSDTIDPDRSRAGGAKLLEEIASGRVFKSIFLNGVMNSVPFQKDRECIVTIVQALSSPNTVVYPMATALIVSSHLNTLGLTNGGDGRPGAEIKFQIGYEDNVTLGEFGSKPKVQKHFWTDDFTELFSPAYFNVKSWYRRKSGVIVGRCTRVKPLSKRKLIEALELEFDLPYPDGSRMNLVDEAKRAFGERLGISL